MRTPTHRTARAGAFTLIELLVVIAVIALLMGILLPSLAAARDSAKTVKCASGLRQLAAAAISYSNDYKGLYCSGPWEGRWQVGNAGIGPIEEEGWVANYLKGSYLVPGNILCPSSQCRSSQNLSLNRVVGQAYKGQAYTYTVDSIKEMISSGLNTNYVQSWYMACTDMTSPYATRAPNPKDNRYFQGALRDSKISSAASTSRVPFFGDGSGELVAKNTNPDYVIMPDGQKVFGAKALTDGPVLGIHPDLGGGVWMRQDYTDFGPAHGRAKNQTNTFGGTAVYGQISFADGHVELFRDNNNDGQFGWKGGIIRGINTIVYDELEPKVFGGWLTRPGLEF